MKNLIRAVGMVFPGLVWLYSFIDTQLKTRVKAGIGEMLFALRKGFYIETIRVLNIKKSNVTEYLSDRQYLKLHPINKKFSTIIDNKLYLPMLFKDSPEFVPTYYYVTNKGRLTKLDLTLYSDQGLYDLCKVKKKLVLKPCTSIGGEGFFLLEWKNDNYYLNNKEIKQTELESFINSLENYLISEYISQHPYANAINPDTTNTIRLFVLLDNDKNVFIIRRALHRFGRAGSFVDNIGSAAGGLASFIDISTGTLTKIGFFREKNEILKPVTIDKHPDTQMQISGLVIPGWENMLSKLLNILQNKTFLKFFGMDVVITETGFKIIEINSLPAITGFQYEGGVFADEKLGKFFRSL